MKKNALHFGACALALVFGIALSAGRADTNAIFQAKVMAPKACSAAGVAGLKLDAVRVKSITETPAGNLTLPGAPMLTNLPAFCRVEAVVETSSDSQINFEVWLPAVSSWNGKLVTTGNGGYSNGLNYGDMAQAMRQGYATIGGDTGHQTPTPDDLLWGVGHPEKIIDWGARSVHSITEAGKRITEWMQGTPARRAYFCGCSTGGHQGYAEIQRYPKDFDGVIAGAPGNNRVRLNAGFLWQFLSNHNSNDNTTPIIPAWKLPLITRAVVATCDARDGVVDGVVDGPRTSDFDPPVPLCRNGDADNCLTATQLAALQKMYAGPKNPCTGEQIYPGWPKSSEALTGGGNGLPVFGGNRHWGTSEPTRAHLWRHWVFNDPQWNWWGFDFDQDLARAETKVGAMVDQVNANIGAFKARGGKALAYQGWQDPVVNAIDTIAYYDRVKKLQGSQQETEKFFRLFLVPGMGHCSGGTGTTNFGNQGSPSPINDPDHDILAALDNWVEKGVAPEKIIASKALNGVTVRTRPLCPYPRRAVYKGSGSTDDAANFICRPDSSGTPSLRRTPRNSRDAHP